MLLSVGSVGNQWIINYINISMTIWYIYMIINHDNSNLIIIEKKNEVYITVDCESDIQREISEFFTFYVPGYKFMPAFRNRMWDGKIRLFSQKTKEIYFGLVSIHQSICRRTRLQYSGWQRCRDR